MRIDLLLKRLCLVKTRSQAKRGCDTGCVKVGGRSVKPSQEIRAGDIVEIAYPDRILVVEIVETPAGQASRRDRWRYMKVVRETPTVRPEEGWDA